MIHALGLTNLVLDIEPLYETSTRLRVLAGEEYLHRNGIQVVFGLMLRLQVM